MKDNLFEEKIIHSFDGLSVEEMDELLKDIDPCDFSMDDGISKKRIERKVLKDTKAGAKKQSVKFRGLAAAAVLIICTVGFFSVNVEARELLKRLFSFIPGIGVVESDTSYYVLDDSTASVTDAGFAAEDDKLRIKVMSASVREGRAEIRYVAELKKADPEYIYDMTSENMPAAEANALMAEYYNGEGYGECFDISNDTEIYGQVIRSSEASLYIGDKEYKVETSDCNFGEASGWKNLEVCDVFAIDQASFDETQEMMLKVGGLSVPLHFTEASAYETKEALNEENNTCTRNGVTLVADPEWKEDAFYVDVYVSDYGDYKELDSLWGGSGYAEADQCYPYIMVDGTMVEATVDSSRTGATHFVFSYDEIGRSDSYELHFPLISMIKDEEVTIELGDKTPGETVEAYGREVKGQSSDLIKVEKVELIPRRDIIDPQYDWDSYTIYADSGFDKEVVDIAKIKIAEGADKQTTLTYFRNASFDGREIDGITNMVNSSPDDIPDQWTEVPLGEKLEDVHTITLKNAVYDLRYDFTFNLSR